jgi:hypothetical protein
MKVSLFYFIVCALAVAIASTLPPVPTIRERPIPSYLDATPTVPDRRD